MSNKQDEKLIAESLDEGVSLFSLKALSGDFGDIKGGQARKIHDFISTHYTPNNEIRVKLVHMLLRYHKTQGVSRVEAINKGRLVRDVKDLLTSLPQQQTNKEQ